MWANVQELDSVEATVRAVELGLGAAFLPRIAVQRELDRGSLAAVPLDIPQTLTAHISAVLNPAKYRPKAVQMLLHNLCPAAFPEPATSNNGSETSAATPSNGKEALVSGTASGNGIDSRTTTAVAAAASIGAASGAAQGATTKLGTIAGAISGAASGAAYSAAAVMSASNGLPGDLFFSSTRHSNGAQVPAVPQSNLPATNGIDRGSLQLPSTSMSSSNANGASVTAGLPEQEESHPVHATAGVYNSLNVERTSAAVEVQTQEQMGGQPGMQDLRQTAWPGFSEVLAVQSAETESQPSPHRAGCFIPDWSFGSGPQNGMST